MLKWGCRLEDVLEMFEQRDGLGLAEGNSAKLAEFAQLLQIEAGKQRLDGALFVVGVEKVKSHFSTGVVSDGMECVGL